MTATNQQPVAEICSASHDDAQFGERDIKLLRDISGFEYGTPLYAGAAPAAVAPQGEYPHEQMDAMALARYKVVPSHASMLWSHAVVAGHGAQQLYVGREVECQNMARKFAGAFLDGAFAFHSMAAAPTAQAAPALEAPAALLTKPALVGSCRFGVGVPERYVIDAAQRHHEQEGQREAMTAEQFADEERKRRTLWELIHGPLAAAPQAPAAPVCEDCDDTGTVYDGKRVSFCPTECAASVVERRADAAAPAAPAVDAQGERDAAFEAVRQRLCRIPRWSFHIDSRGNIRRVDDARGNWIEFSAAHELLDPVAVDAAIAAQAAAKGDGGHE